MPPDNSPSQQIGPIPLFGGTPVRKPLLLFPLFLLASEHEECSPKKYDGLGFRIVKKEIIEPKYHMANFKSPNAFKWPAHDKRDIAKDLVGRCDDLRTAATFKFEAFDLCEKGDAVPYFRKQMLILKKVIEKPGIRADRIMDDMSRNHVEEIYPGLNPVLMEVLVEELAAIGFVTIRDSEVSATGPGEAKLREFTSSLTIEERKALELS